MAQHWPQRVLVLCWGLILIGLVIRAWRQPGIAGSYDQELDALLYSGQRLLRGGLLFQDHVLALQPPAQYLFAPSALLGSLRAHRLLILLVDAIGALLLVRTCRQFGAAGLLPMAKNSLLPVIGGMLYVVFSQMMRGGAAGHLHHYANLLLVLALFLISRKPGRSATDLYVAGGALFLAISCFVSLGSSILIATAVVLARHRRPFASLRALLLGGLLAAVLVFLPYLFEPGGIAVAWAGAVVLPLEWAARNGTEVGEQPEVLGRLLSSSVGGLPVWLLGLLPFLGLLRRTARQWQTPIAGSDQPLLIPGLALITLLDMGWSLQRGHVESHDLLLLLLPLLLLFVSGLAELELDPIRGLRVAALASLVLVSLIWTNNIALAALLRSPRPPQGLVADVEADRSLLRQYLSRLPAEARSFTAPQDIALQWQLGQPAATRGIGPEWSLDQLQLRPSWATRRLGLPSGMEQACRQLTAADNRHVVWRSTDSEGPNSDAFLRSCLGADASGWHDISDKLGLRTGEFRVFSRNGP